MISRDRCLPFFCSTDWHERWSSIIDHLPLKTNAMVNFAFARVPPTTTVPPPSLAHQQQPARAKKRWHLRFRLSLLLHFDQRGAPLWPPFWPWNQHQASLPCLFQWRSPRSHNSHAPSTTFWSIRYKDGHVLFLLHDADRYWVRLNLWWKPINAHSSGVCGRRHKESMLDDICYSAKLVFPHGAWVFPSLSLIFWAVNSIYLVFWKPSI